MLTTMADVVFVLDESGSEEEAFTHEWVRALVTGDVNNNGLLDSGEKSLATKLAEEGIGDVRYGLVGFGENDDNLVRFAHSQLFDIASGDPQSLFGDPTSATSSGPDDPFVDTADLNTIFGTMPNGNLNQFGGDEDGWDALEHVVAEYDFRDMAVPIVVLVQNDEGRVVLNDTLTRDGVLAALRSKNIILNSFVVGDTINVVADPFSADWSPVFTSASFGGRILGVEADGADHVFNGLHNFYGYDTAPAQGVFNPLVDTVAGSTSLWNGASYDLNQTETNDTYIQLAWDTGGAAWDIGVLDAFAGAHTSQANELRDKLIVSLIKQIDNASATGNVYRDADILLALNLGGDALDGTGGTTDEGFVADDGTYTADMGYFDVHSGFRNRQTASSTIQDSGSNSRPLNLESPAAPVSEVFQTARTTATNQWLQVSHNGSNTGVSGMVDSGKSVLISPTPATPGAEISAFGYSAESVSATFQSFSGNETTILDDTDSGAVTISDVDLGDFSFQFFGQEYHELAVHMDGLITLGNSSFLVDTENFDLDSTLSPGPLVAVLWENLATDQSGGQVLWEVLGTGTQDERLLVQWDDVAYFDDVGPEFQGTDVGPITFQAVLYADGRIQLNYQNIEAVESDGDVTTENNGNEATIGIATNLGQGSDLHLTIDTLDGITPMLYGPYFVELFFAAIESSPNFDVQLEGVTLLDGYNVSNDLANIVGNFGGNNIENDVSSLGFNKGIVKRYLVSVMGVTGGEGLQIDLLSETSGVAPQLNGIRILDSGILGGDYDQDGDVDGRDFLIWMRQFGNQVEPFTGADGNGNGLVDGFDLTIWQHNYGATTSTPTALAALAIVAGDYNLDGVVNNDDYNLWQSTFGSTTNLAADGNDNGIVDNADLAILQETFMITTLDVLPGDFDGNGVVDTADYTLWENGDPLADADGDSDVDQDDYDIWNDNFGLTSAAKAPLIVGSTVGLPLEIPMAAPRVTGFTISGSNSLDPAYDFSSVVGSGEQLRTVPVGGADTVSIRFSEEVFVTQNALQVINLDGTSPTSVTSFTYDLSTQTATWQFNSAFADGRHVFTLADSVIDLDHDNLDGEFDNPLALTDTSTGVFASGDYRAGGEFRFRATILAGDSDRDNIDGSTNYTKWLSYEPGRIYVSTTADELDTNYTVGDMSLREAVKQANAAGGPMTIVVPAGHFVLSRSGTEAGNASYNDLDITGDVTIVGKGAGLTMLDASGISNPGYMRVFEVAAGARLDLSKATLTTGTGFGYSTGLAVNVASGGELVLTDSAVVNHNNYAYPAIDAKASILTIRRSVFTNNYGGYGSAAVHVSTGTGSATVTIGQSIFALNQGGPYGNTTNVEVVGNVTKINEGYNLFDDIDGGFFDTTPGTGDYLGTPDYVVTSIADTFNHADDGDALSLREAVDLANNDSGASEVWLPAWAFVLTRDRTTYGTGTTDLNVAFGDLDITDSLVVRGVSGQTSVQWTAGVNDTVFDLIGDFNQDGQSDQSVSGSDFLEWQRQFGSGSVDPSNWEQFSADADDDGDVDSADQALWSSYYGNTLDLFDILV